MLNRWRSNTIAKKTSIFVVVFAVTCILMGTQLEAMRDEEHLVAALLNAMQAGQAESDRSQLRQAVGELVFPFSGEYPSLAAEPLPAKPQIEVRLPEPGGFVYTDNIPLSYNLQRYTYDQCVERGLEYELVLALMWRESRFQVDAVGYNANGTQDSGIMQINDINRAWLKEYHGIEDLMDPWQNIDAGTIMLSMFVDKYGVHDGLMAYQYGEQGMQQKMAEGVVTNDNIAILIDKRNDFLNLLQNT